VCVHLVGSNFFPFFFFFFFRSSLRYLFANNRPCIHLFIYLFIHLFSACQSFCAQVRQHDGQLVNRIPQATTTFTLQLQVEGIGSLQEAMANFFAPAVSPAT